MSQAGIRFAKTVLGAQEIETRAIGISPKLRRILIMIDGQRTVAELEALVRPGELDDIISQLVANQLIADRNMPAFLLPPAAPGFTPALPNAAPRPATDLAAFERVRHQAAQSLLDTLGPGAEPLSSRIEHATNPVELRSTLRDLEGQLVSMLGDERGLAFARRFGHEVL